jgi:hypothetical protein
MDVVIARDRKMLLDKHYRKIGRCCFLAIVFFTTF